LWPEFDTTQLGLALEWYGTRQRRFGRVVPEIRRKISEAENN
jgi:hypothetical protein